MRISDIKDEQEQVFIQKIIRRLQRLNRKNSIEELAQLTCCTKKIVQKYFHAEEIPHLVFLVQCCEIFGCSLDWLLGRIPENMESPKPIDFQKNWQELIDRLPWGDEINP